MPFDELRSGFALCMLCLKYFKAGKIFPLEAPVTCQQLVCLMQCVGADQNNKRILP